jgi:peptidoglycan/LPS O-acetylase OafA/YrhL
MHFARQNISRYNNFDFLRVLFAISVIVSHSYIFYTGAPVDWLSSNTGSGLSFSDLGLSGFFCISGYLVFLSSQRSPSYWAFIWKRILRIFPGLIVVTTLIVFLLGPIVANIPGYFSHPSPYIYWYSNIALYDRAQAINGVFTTNPYPNNINGALWTIIYEFLFYLLFFFLFLSKRLNSLLPYACPLAFITIVYLYWTHQTTGYQLAYTSIKAKWFMYFACWFLAGMLLAIYRKHWLRNNALLALAALPIVVLIVIGTLPKFSLFFAWPCLIIGFGTGRTPLISKWEQLGDPSYGIYIYGFVAQQTLIYYLKDSLSFLQYMLVSILVAAICGWLSWHIVEKQALKLKRTKEAEPQADLSLDMATAS